MKRDKDGYFLLVEAGRLDHAHHANWAHVAMEEFVALDDAVEVNTNSSNVGFGFSFPSSPKFHENG